MTGDAMHLVVEDHGDVLLIDCPCGSPSDVIVYNDDTACPNCGQGYRVTRTLDVSFAEPHMVNTSFAEPLTEREAIDFHGKAAFAAAEAERNERTD